MSEEQLLLDYSNFLKRLGTITNRQDHSKLVKKYLKNRDDPKFFSCYKFEPRKEYDSSYCVKCNKHKIDHE